ncbi:MAG: shikimate kinase [Paludibacteraceae bacterium]|nr:shikimate kinase [Paludibacteraceae bacterium]MBP5136198.1 shikimate kinase [Paludibacteraceae bacterium]MBP5743141.1 shikimate kinase [Paludibacteraceae bacterium]
MERVYLIGYMGCGKTTIGKKLAKGLDWDVIDMDSRIENRYRKKIEDIFATEGEESFRKKERFILEELSALENVVVSTGGGAPCFFDNIDVMNASGLCVYIRMTPEALAERLKHAKANRPLLKDKTEEELADFIRQQLDKRKPFYEQAQFVIDNDNGTPEEAARKIMDLLNS